MKIRSVFELNSTDPTCSWVDHEVFKIESNIKRLNKSLTPSNLINPNTTTIDPAAIKLAACTDADRVCRSRAEGETEFFYVYETFFTLIKLRLPFSDFQVSILNAINAAPTQLHPHSWIFIRCFELLCISLDLAPTVDTFFYFFRSLEKKKGWVYVTMRQGRKILEFDKLSDKHNHFKKHFFRIEGGDGEGGGSVPFFLDENRKPKFPLYWCKEVLSPPSLDLLSLSRSEQKLVCRLKKMKTPVSCADLITRHGGPLLPASSDAERNLDVEALGQLEEEGVETGVEEEEEEEAGKRKKIKVCVEQQMEDRHHDRPPGLEAGEGVRNAASVWDGSFDVDRHVCEQLFFCGDQDKLRRIGHVDVGRLLKSDALRMAVGVEFLTEELKVTRKNVLRLTSELDEERKRRIKAEAKLEKTEKELAAAKEESAHTGRLRVEEWKKSVNMYFQKALEQVPFDLSPAKGENPPSDLYPAKGDHPPSDLSPAKGDHPPSDLSPAKGDHPLSAS